MPTSLQDARERIDDIDHQVVALLAKRQEVVDEVAKTKASAGREVRDPEREDELLDRVRDLADDAGLSPDLVSRLYEQILAHSVRRQRRQRDDGSSDAAAEADASDAPSFFPSARAA